MVACHGATKLRGGSHSAAELGRPARPGLVTVPLAVTAHWPQASAAARREIIGSLIISARPPSGEPGRL